MAPENEVTLEQAIQSITQAADEFKVRMKLQAQAVRCRDANQRAFDEQPEDFINYSTILDVHLSHALQEFSPEDQAALLQAIEKVLTAHVSPPALTASAGSSSNRRFIV